MNQTKLELRWLAAEIVTSGIGAAWSLFCLTRVDLYSTILVANATIAVSAASALIRSVIVLSMRSMITNRKGQRPGPAGNDVEFVPS